MSFSRYYNDYEIIMIDNLNDLYLKKCSFAIEENGIKKVKK
jgi:hypothetical protein